MKPFFVYMLECSDRSLYVGHTDDLEIRIAQHESGALGGHTSTRRPVRLVWCAEMESREEALGCELQLKGWSRAKKRALIEGDWALLKRLARGPDRVHRGSAAQASSFDSGPVSGGPYAQDERWLARARETPVRPARSGRAAAAESKGDTGGTRGTRDA